MACSRLHLFASRKLWLHFLQYERQSSVRAWKLVKYHQTGADSHQQTDGGGVEPSMPAQVQRHISVATSRSWKLKFPSRPIDDRYLHGLCVRLMHA
jgi:hypothetical protein